MIPRTPSADPGVGVSRYAETRTARCVYVGLVKFSRTWRRENWQVGGNGVVSCCGRVLYSGRSRPADHRGARIETCLVLLLNRVEMSPRRSSRGAD